MMRKLLPLSSLYGKFVLIVMLITAIISVSLGTYSYNTSEKQVIDKVSQTNLAVVDVIKNNMNAMQRSVNNWVTVFILSSAVQQGLHNNWDNIESVLYTGPTSSIMDQMLVTGDLDYLALYGNTDDPVYQLATDQSSGPLPLSVIRDSFIYQETIDLNGAPNWFPLTGQNNSFIEYNRMDKLGMSRMIKSTLDGNPIGFIFVGINHQTIQNKYLDNLYDKDHGILILDEEGNPLLSAGKTLHDESLSIIKQANTREAGSWVENIQNEDLLLTSGHTDNGWQIIYAVPMHLLTRELESIKWLSILMILAGILLSIPLSMMFSAYVTAPIKKLLRSMRRFQSGNFDEKVEINSRDEIGMLGQGYNKMVASIKELVNETYVLRLREKEAELKALQSQINPHFLYNMLDTIFWEAERAKQPHISEMVISLSRLFRLSLNQGKTFTSLGKEKQLIQHYLTLQSMRFKDKLTYRIDIPEELDHYVILKLCLQPFIENALVHGIERKRGDGHVHVNGILRDGYLIFTIEDNGSGMSAETLQALIRVKEEPDVNTSLETSGYAIQNVIQRLQHYYQSDYELNMESEPGIGTRVTLTIPARTEEEVQHVEHDGR